MSDDTKALIDRLRDHENEGVTGSDRFHLRNGAADAIERLERGRDALAERCEKLREALRAGRKSLSFGMPAQNYS